MCKQITSADHQAFGNVVFKAGGDFKIIVVNYLVVVNQFPGCVKGLAIAGTLVLK